MSELNPRYLFPAPGWKCYQCTIVDGCVSGEARFQVCTVIGWGVCYNPDVSDMQLLVALQDAPFEAPMVYPSSALEDLFTNVVFGFLRSGEIFDDDEKAVLEKKAREKLAVERAKPNFKLILKSEEI